MTGIVDRLRVANALELEPFEAWSEMRGIMLAAADEIERLTKAHDWQYTMAGERLRRVEKLETAAGLALYALRLAASDPVWPNSLKVHARVPAAIKALEDVGVEEKA